MIFLKNYFYIIALLLLMLTTTPCVSYESAWELWIVPDKYTINTGETIAITFGLSGYGELDPANIKIVAYSEKDTKLSYGDRDSSYEVILIALKPSTEKNIFRKKIAGYLDYPFLKTDSESPFDKLFIQPSSYGNKKVTLIVTYSIDGKSWQTTSKEFDYHVNSWTEEYQVHLAIFGLIIAFFTLGPGPFAISFGKFIANKSNLIGSHFFMRKKKLKKFVPVANKGGIKQQATGNQQQASSPRHP